MLGDRMPIEPLSRARWERVERRVLDALDAPADEAAPSPAHAGPASWRTIAAAAVAAVALLGVVALVLLARGALVTPVAAPIAPSRVATAAGTARATLGDATVELSPDTAVLSVPRGQDGWLVVLERGRAKFAVPGRRQSVFVVQAAEVRVEVVGTRFVVDRSGPSTRVEVEEGVVRVIAHDRSVTLRRGQRWSSSRAPGSPERQAAEVAGPAIPGSADAPTERATGVVEGPERAPHPDSRGPARTSSRSDAGGREGSPPPSGSRSPRASFYEAGRIEAYDPVRAAALYREIESMGGAWGANALFARAQLELRRGRRDLARALLSTYLRRHPRGANADDARSLLGRP